MFVGEVDGINDGSGDRLGLGDLVEGVAESRVKGESVDVVGDHVTAPSLPNAVGSCDG